MPAPPGFRWIKVPMVWSEEEIVLNPPGTHVLYDEEQDRMRFAAPVEEETLGGLHGDR